MDVGWILVWGVIIGWVLIEELCALGKEFVERVSDIDIGGEILGFGGGVICLMISIFLEFVLWLTEGTFNTCYSFLYLEILLWDLCFFGFCASCVS